MYEVVGYKHILHTQTQKTDNLSLFWCKRNMLLWSRWRTKWLTAWFQIGHKFWFLGESSVCHLSLNQDFHPYALLCLKFMLHCVIFSSHLKLMKMALHSFCIWFLSHQHSASKCAVRAYDKTLITDWDGHENRLIISCRVWQLQKNYMIVNIGLVFIRWMPVRIQMNDNVHGFWPWQTDYDVKPEWFPVTGNLHRRKHELNQDMGNLIFM